jgi:transposase-like protein
MPPATRHDALRGTGTQFEPELSGAPPANQGEREEVERLRRELRDLQAENSLLKKAAALFAKDVK